MQAGQEGRSGIPGQALMGAPSKCYASRCVLSACAFAAAITAAAAVLPLPPPPGEDGGVAQAVWCCDRAEGADHPGLHAGQRRHHSGAGALRAVV